MNGRPQEHRYNIRCAFVDPERPSHEDGERHWRCPAWFPFDIEAPPHQQLHCPMHRTRPGTVRATRQEFDAAISRFFGRLEAKAEDFDDSNPAELEARKRQLRQEAIAAGVLAREAGEDDE